MAWLYALAWPPLWQLQRQLAQRYLSLGVAGSALTIFEKLGLYEKQVECLMIMDRKPKALELVRGRLVSRQRADGWVGRHLGSLIAWIRVQMCGERAVGFVCKCTECSS